MAEDPQSRTSEHSAEEIEVRGSYVGAMIRERKLTDRLLDAMQTLRSDRAGFTSLGVADIRVERKAAPDLGQHTYSPPIRYSGTWGRRYDRIDYKAEVGDLHLNSLAMAVVNFTATRIPEARPCVVTRKTNGDEERDFRHPVAKLIKRPNRHHIWPNYAGACSTSWWLNGNVYFYKSRDVTGRVSELWYLPHFLVQPRWPGDGRTPDVARWASEHGEKTSELDLFLSHYQYNVPGKDPVLYAAKDMLHLKRHVDLSNPRVGIGPFESLYMELCADKNMALFTSAIFKNMGIQVPVISPKDKADTINEEDALAMKESWIAKTTGERAGEPVVLTAPIDIEKFGFNPTELNTSELRLIIEARVCAVCNISPAALQLMVGVQNGTSYASSEQARQQGYEEVIIPIQDVWADELDAQLLNEFDNSEEGEFEFDTSKVRVLQEDTDALFRREVDVFRAGGTTYDQFLAAIGKKAVGPPLGDVRLVPSTAQPTNPDQLIAKSDGSLAPEPIDPLEAEALAKFADLERLFEGLERQMKGFEVQK